MTAYLFNGKTLRMRAVAMKIKQIMNLDQVGTGLSLLCAIHCILTPLALLFLPVFVGRAFENPMFHWILALMIIPIGLKAFVAGYKHHKRMKVFMLGIPGLLIVGVIPLVFPVAFDVWTESILMIIGSCLLISAHWLNRKSCSCEIHGAGT